MVYTLTRLLALLFFKLLFRLEVFGKENIPRKGGFILAANHVSYLDPVGVGVASPRKLNFMAKEELFRVRWFGRFLSAICVFPVKRDSADLSAIKEAIRRVKSGGALAMFPEGGRRFESASGEPQAGIGFLAAKLGVSVIPAFIKGSDIALPKGAKFIRPHKIRVYFGRGIVIERGDQSYQEIASRIMSCIRELDCDNSSS